MMTGVCKTYWQALLAQGVTIGLEFSCLLLLYGGFVSYYLLSRRAIAFGIASIGGCIGESSS